MAEENLTKGKEDRVGDGGGGEIEKKKRRKTYIWHDSTKYTPTDYKHEYET